MSTFASPDASLPILCNMVIFLNASVIFFTLDSDAVFEVFLYPVVADDRVGSEVVFGKDLDADVLAFTDLVHHDVRVGTH